MLQPVTSIRTNNFDLIRLIAAIQVVIVHGVEHIGLGKAVDPRIWYWLNTFPGVPIFFVISGFLISRSWERESFMTSYATKRILRIYPALYVCLIVSILSVLVASPATILNANIAELLGWCFAQLTVAQFFNPSFLRTYGVGVLNGSLWTIPVELQFYCMIPIIYWMFGLRVAKKNVLLCVVMLLFLSFAYCYENIVEERISPIVAKLVAVTMLPYFWMFLLGVLVQRNWLTLARFFENRFLIWIIGYILVVVALDRLGLQALGNAQFPLATLALSGVVFSAAYTARGLSQVVLRGNDISYGIYIYHMVVINFMLACGIQGGWLTLLFVFLCTTALAILSWKLVEEVALSLKPQNRARETKSLGSL